MYIKLEKVSKLGRRLLSVLLCAVLLASTFLVFDPSVLRANAKVNTATNKFKGSIAEQSAYAPETIYLKPGSNTFQYFCNYDRISGSVGENGGIGTSSVIYFANHDASSIRLFVNAVYQKGSSSDLTSSLRLKYNGSLQSVTRANVAWNRTTAATGTALITSNRGEISYTLDSSSGTFNGAEGGVYIIEWVAEYVIGSTYHFAFMYTGIYKPLLDQAGIASFMSYKNEGSDAEMSESFSFLTGAHKYSGGTHRSMMLKTSASGTSPNYAAPLISFVGSGQDSTTYSVPHGQNVVPSSSTASTDAFAAVNNGGVITHYNNSNHESDAMEGRFWGKITNESTLTYETEPTGQFVYNNGTVLDQSHTCGVSYIVVDTSRYSNYNQIPNFSAGWAQYFHQNGKNGNRLDKITNCTVNDSGMTDLDTVTCTVDTSNYDSHDDASIARGLYKLNGSIIRGVTHMHYSFVTSWRFKILGIKAITETLNGEHVLAFHTTTVNKSDLREGYANTLNSHVDYANMTTAGIASDYQSFYNNLKADAGKLCDPTDHTGASANAAAISSSNGTLARGGNVLNYETRISTNSNIVSTDDFVYFNVPETVYLTPSTSSSTVNFQYVLDQSCVLNSTDLTVTQTPNIGYKAISNGANVYFYYKKAQNVKITYSGATLTGLNNINTSINLSGNNTSLTTARFTGGSKANSNGYITWTATYLDAADGITKSVTAKTYVYRPFTGVLAASASAVSSHNSSKYQVGVSSLMYGVHSIKNSGAAGIRTGDSWWGSTGSDGTGSWKQSPMTTTGFSDTYPAPTTWHGNEDATALYNVDATNSYSSTSGGTWWWMGSQRNEGSNIIGGTGRLYIDSKRVSKIGDIPYLSAYIEYGGSSDGDDWRESDCQSYYYIGNTSQFETNAQNSITERSALASYAFTRETAGTPKRRTDRSYANESISAGNSFVYRAYGHIKRKNGDHHAGDAFTKVDFLNGDKTNLRSAVEYANKYNYALQEKFFDTTSSYWTTYTSALSAAQNALGIVASAENAALATNLTNAVNNLISGNNARSSKTAKQVNIGLKANQDGTYTQIRISPDEALTDFSKTLNSYDRVNFTAESYAGFTFIGCKNYGSTAPSSSSLANVNLSALPTFDTQSSHSACGEGVTFADAKGSAITYSNAVKGNNYNYVYYYLLKPDVLFDNYYDFDAISFVNGKGLSSVAANYAANTLSLTSGSDTDCYVSASATRMALTAGHTYRLLYTSQGGSPRATVLPYDSATGGSYSSSYYKENLASGGTFTVYSGYTYVFVRWGNLTPNSKITYSNIIVQDITNIHGKTDDVSVPIPRFKQFTPGDQIGSLSEINRTGYTFNGWYDGKDSSGNGNGNQYAPASAPTSYKNVYLWSKWTRNSITLTVKPNGGKWNSSTSDQSFTQEYSTTKSIANAQRDAYNFKGWDHGGDINGEFDPDTKLFTFGPTNGSKDTLTALWEPVNYTISFDPNCGAAVNSMTYSIESTSTLPTCSRFGYNFAGWKPISTVNNWNSGSVYYAGSSVKGKYGNVTLKAQWSVVSFTVSYDLNGGNVAKDNPTSYDAATPRVIIENPTKTGYTFKGWTGSNGTAPQKNVCIPLNQITDSSVLNYSTSAPYNAGSRDHYFGNSFRVTPGEELRVLVRAKRTAGARSINGGIWYGRETGVEGYPYDGVSGAFRRIDNNASSADAVNGEWNYYYKDITVPDTKLTGKVYYQIDQFSSNGFDTVWQLAECVVVKKTDYKNLEFTANWEADKYTMTLDYNGGKLGANTTGSYQVTYDSTDYYTLKGWGVPSKPGYSFDGFWTSKTGGTRIYENSGDCLNDGTYWLSNKWKNTGGATFYAHWTRLEYTITYKNAEGCTAKAYSVEDSFKLPAPSKTGFSFVNWAQSDNTGNWSDPAYDGEYPVSGKYGNVTLTAVWSEDTYSVRYLPGSETSGTLPAVQTIKYSETENLATNDLTRSDADLGKVTFVFYSGRDNEYGTAKRSYSPNGWSKTRDGAKVYDNEYLMRGTELIKAVNSNNTLELYTAWSSADTSAAFPTDTLRLGYTFAGWWSQADGGEQFTSYTGTGDITLYAHWIPYTYTVKFNGNGGSGSMDDQSFTYDVEQALSANSFTKTGYESIGWSTSSSASAATYTDKQRVKNLTSQNGATIQLNAVWQPVTYTVVFHKNNISATGTDGSAQTMTYDKYANLVSTDYALAGHHIKGWSTSSDSSDIAYNPEQNVRNLTDEKDAVIDLYAVWTVNNDLTVTYDGNGANNGIAPYTQTFTYNIAQELTENRFERSYTVSFDKNMPATSASVPVIGADSLDSVYTFEGWNDKSDGSGEYNYTDKQVVANPNGITDGNTRLYAKWTGGSVALTSAELTGYTFNGWFTEKTGGTKVGISGEAYYPTGDIVLYAHWTINTVTLHYDANGGSGSMEDQIFTYNIAQSLKSNSFTRKHTLTFAANAPEGRSPSIGADTATASYSFSGWNSAADGNGATSYTNAQANVRNPNGVTAGETTIYAKWTGGGVNLPSASLNGYTFLGWFTAEVGGDRVGGAGSVYKAAKDITLYAQWEINTGTLIIKPNGGKWNGSENDQTLTGSYGETRAIQKPQRDGFSFSGWTKSNIFSGTFNYAANQSSTDYTYSSSNGYVDTLTAKWTAWTYKVYYNSNDDTNVRRGPQNFRFGTPAELTANTFTRSGYQFLGWAESPDATQAQYTDKESFNRLPEANGVSVELYAVWKADPMTITYLPNGGSGVMDDQSFDFGSPVTLNENRFTNNYTVTFISNGGTVADSEIAAPRSFNGWLKDNTGSVISDKQTVEDSFGGYAQNVKLYAQWGDAYIEKLQGASKNGNILLGWSTSADSSQPEFHEGDALSVASDLTLYAVWLDVAKIKSATCEAVDEGCTSVIVVTTSSDVNKVQLIGSDGGTKTVNESTLNDNGTRTWNIEQTRRAGEYDYALKAKVGQKWIDEGMTVRAVVNAVEPKVGRILDINYERSVSTVNTYFVKVENRAAKVRVIGPDGGTATYSRYNASVKSIESFANDGLPVSTFSRNLGYEIWEIEMRLVEDDYTAVGKYGSEWNNNEPYSFDVTLAK